MYSSDSSNPEVINRAGIADMVENEFSEKTSWMDPELMAIKEEDISKWLEEDRFAPIATRILSIEEKSRTILESFENFEISRKRSFELIDTNEDSSKAQRDFEDVSKQFIYLFCETLAIYNYHNYKEGIITTKNLEEMCRRLNNNENLESLNFILLTEKPSTKEIASSINFLEYESNKSNKRI